jgi:hypothetical protein
MMTLQKKTAMLVLTPGEIHGNSTAKVASVSASTQGMDKISDI